MFEDVIEQIEKRKDIVLATHILPDGDAIGSLFALGIALRAAGKNVQATWGGRPEVPEQYAFLPGQELLSGYDDITENPSLLISLDCGSKERLGAAEKLLKKADMTINIDHHRNNTMFARINVVQSSYPATAQMVYELLHEMNIPVSPDIALNLYTGLVTDTGRFQYSNTKADTFRVASELVERGVDPSYVFNNVYENSSYKRLRLSGLALSKTVFEPEIGFIYTTITRDDFAATGASVEDTENLIDFLRAVAGVTVAAVFKETDGGLRVSLRSTGSVDVGAIAASKAGGGHKAAAGYNGSGAIEDAISDLRDSLPAQTD